MCFKVSVIVPVYGVEHYIERCARSLFEQTYPNLEFVFVNDCTVDKSMEILKTVMADYPERKESVRIVGHENNRGLAAARNTGLDNARGDFVCLVDSDDWLELNALELLVKKQVETKSDLVSGNRMVHYPDKDCILQERQYQDREEMTVEMMQHFSYHFITGRLIKRSLFVDNRLQWKEGLDGAEDRYMMTLLAYYVQVFAVVDSVVYHYERRNVNAITMSRDMQRIFCNNEQELGNVLLLKQFFHGKESVYQEECAKCVMRQLEHNLNIALAYSSKGEFEKIVCALDGYSNEEWGIIGWGKTGVKGWRLHNFRWMRLNWLKGKAVRYVKKGLSKTKSFPMSSQCVLIDTPN